VTSGQAENGDADQRPAWATLQATYHSLAWALQSILVVYDPLDSRNGPGANGSGGKGNGQIQL